MRLGLLLIGALLSAPPALAQDAAVSIPFAPQLSSFAIDEVRTRTYTENGQTRTRSGRVRSTLEIRARQGAYEAVWTTNSADPAAIVIDNGGADPTLLIGERIRLMLDEAGAPISMSDWEGVRRRMFRIMLENERDPFWRRAYTATERVMARWSPETAAPQLMETLSMMSACHHTDLTPGEPQTADVPAQSALAGGSTTMRVTWELESIDREAGVARIVHTRTPDVASLRASLAGVQDGLARLPGAESETVGGVEHRTECVVDLRSGMTRSATFEVRLSLGGETDIRRRVITVTRADQ